MLPQYPVTVRKLISESFNMRLWQGTTWLPDDDLMIEIFWSDFRYFNVKFYISALVGIIKVTQRSARCNNKDHLERLKICRINKYIKMAAQSLLPSNVIIVFYLYRLR